MSEKEDANSILSTFFYFDVNGELWLRADPEDIKVININPRLAFKLLRYFKSRR